MTDIQGPWTWERNGNFQSHYHSIARMMEDEGCGLHDMDGCPLPPSNNFHCSEADWNSNKFVNSIEKKTDQDIPDSNPDCCTCKTYSDSEENHNKGFLRDNSTLSPNSPTSIFTASLHHKDISYDDLSKNIDANLAEIDMETFRSEDINSILALPAIYSGDFQSASHGEQCASVSGSLLNGLELDSSVSPRNSEDEISICKDEPLFSPLKEPPVPESTISVDSLDSSSIYDHDFVLTCQANKNNYTIVFEGSGTQFSDDSDYQEVCGSSEGESSVSGATQLNHRSTCYGGKGSSMVQSDLVFTTWSKLRRTQRGSKRRSETTTDFSTKSQSLPNLSHHSVFITDKHLAHWATWRGNNCLPLYDIQSCHSNGLQIAHSKDHAHSVSLLKLFMKHKIPVSNSLEISSSHSDSSSSIIIQPLNVLNSSLETSLNWSNHKSIQENAEGNNQVNRKNKGEVQIEYKNDNETAQTQLLVDNIKLSDWNSPQNVTEANNNTINSLYSMDNNNVSNHNNWKEETLIISDGEYDNSQYFEDSLVEVPVPQLKVFQTMPIKEEEETDISSGDETMKDSRNPFASDNSSLDDGAIIQNNAVDCVSHGARHEWSNNLERINNIFPTGKSNVLLANETSSFNEEEKLPLKKVGFCPENQSQSTQTKQYNTKECTPIDEVQFPQTTVTKTSSNQTDGDTLNNVCYSLSRDSSPTSSGYASSRHSSVERIRRTSQAFNCITNTSSSTIATATKKSNVMLTTTRTCSTQIPVHVKDIAMQTSLNSASNSYVGFTLKDSDEHIIETDHILEASSKLSSENSVASAEELQQKKKKSIYVCYPNYSLPDLSFLKGVIDKEPEAIYLTPTKYKLPQEIINREKLMRPKSYAGYEAFSEKHLTNIKDWESLNVLLPDNLKHLISQMHAKSSKHDAAFQMDGSCKSKLQQTPPCSCSSSGEIPVFSPSSSSNASDTSCKKHIPRSILRKSSSVGHCEDKCHIYLPPRCSSASSVDIKVVHMKSKQQKVEDGINTSTHVYKISQHSLPENELIINKTLIGSRQKSEISHNVQPQLCNATFVPGTKSFSPNSLLSENPQSHVEKQQSPACFDPLHCHSAVTGFDGHYHKRMTTADITVNEQSKVPFCHYRNQELLHKLNGKLFNLCPDCNSSKLHSIESIQNQLHTIPSNKAAGLVPVQKDIVEENNFHHDPSKGKKAVKFCEKSPMKKTDYSDACMYNDPEEEPCCSSCIQYEIKERNLHEGGVPYPCDDDLDSENPPQEFVVSPTQGSSPFSPPSDFYFMQNSAGGGSKLFQEALRKKTGLVENLQKATEIISEHFQMNGGKKNISQISNNADFLTGQKILACLCPAVHTILSDGLLPTVQGFFGPLPNTPWKVAEASVQQGESRKEVQDLLAHVNAEKLLTDSTYRFNAFIIGLLNLHCLDWWIGHLCTCQSLICHHYHPTALLSLLALPAATHLRQELKELVSPLSNLPFELDLTYETRTTTGDTWSLGNRVRKNADENIKHDIIISTTGAVAKNGDRKRITDLTFRLPPYIDNEREHDVNFKGRNSSIIDLLIPAKAAMNIKESPGEYQEQVWPGITINPFPNIKISEEQTVHDIHNQPKGSKDHYNVNAKLTSHLKPLILAATSHGLSSGHQRNCVKNENESKEKEVPELSLCSSTDSGCSSQAEHSRQTLQAAAKPGAALPAKTDSKEKDGQQFKKLRQKWEKMTLGMDKQSNSKGISQKQIPTKAPFANHSKTRKKPSESVKINRSGSGSPSNRDAHPINHTHREASHSPTGRKTYTQPSAPALFENRLQTPDVIASSQVPYHSPEISKKPKSQIPLLKTGKNSHPKSMIPVHRTGARARSANRDYHTPAV